MNWAHFIGGQPWVERLGWTLIHFLWQGALIAALYAAVRRWLGYKSSPTARYILGCVALAAMITAPFVTFGLRGSMELAQPAARIARIPVGAPTAGPGSTLLDSLSFSSVSSVAAGNENILTWVVMFWLAGAIVCWVRLMGGWVVVARMRSVSVRPAPPEWQQILSKLAARIDLSRPVQLLVSARVQVPIVLGWLRPVVLVPIGALTGLPAEQLEALLIHELAHIRRHDYLVNILQNVSEALLFYHPAVWWVSGHIRTERELCCDDVAVSVSGDVLTYAHALTELESYRSAHLNVAVGASGGSLESRIARLIGVSYPVSRIRPGSSVIVSALLLVVTAYGVFGQSPASPRFEVASIKPNTAGARGLAQTAKPSFEAASVKLNPQATQASMSIEGNRYRATGTTLRRLIMEAYNLRDWQLTAGPSWIISDRWDIEAVADEGTPMLFFNPEDPSRPTAASLMMQALIENRFQFKFHRDMKELSVYELTVTRTGPKFKPSTDQQTPHNRLGRGEIDVQAEPFATFAYDLSRFLDHSLINKVDLTGLYEIKLQWNPDLIAEAESAVSDKPSIFTALQEQLGLKLESDKGPVEILVIDHVEEPSEN